MKTRKIAIIIAGGVSSGAYEAGVLSELLYLLESYNRKSSDVQYLIDVITGGTAGSINGALTARAILHGCEKRSALYRLWVDDADMSKLLERQSTNSLFSTSYQQELGKRYLNVNSDLCCPSNCASEVLKLGFSMEQSADLAEPVGSECEQKLWSRTSHCFTTTLERDAIPKPDQWEAIKQAAIANSYTPITFDQNYFSEGFATLGRDASSTQAEATNPGRHASSSQEDLTHAPVKKAIELAKEIDGDSLSDDRLFLLIDPGQHKQETERNFQDSLDVKATMEKLLHATAGIASAPQTKEWLKIDPINQQVSWHRQLIKSLPELINAIPANLVEPLLQSQQIRSAEIAREMSSNKKVRGAATIESLTHSKSNPSKTSVKSLLEHVKAKYTSEIFSIGIPGESETLFSNRRELFLHLVLGFDASSSLGNKSVIRLCCIGSECRALTNNESFPLLGFFEKKWREHDFHLGRQSAEERIPEILNTQPLPPDPLLGEQLIDSATGREKISISDANIETRKLFYQRTLKFVGSVLATEPYCLGWLKQKLAQWLISKYVKRMLALK